MADTEPSIFTKIINGDIPSHKIYEDDQCFAFLDIHPQVEGHILLVPKQQIDSLWDLPTDVYHHLWDVASQIQSRLHEVLNPPRVGLAVAGFDVPHAHIHILPMQTGSDLKKSQDMSAEPDHEALAALAARIKF